MRPFLTVWEDAHIGQAGMEGERPKTLLLHHYILSTTHTTSGEDSRFSLSMCHREVSSSDARQETIEATQNPDALFWLPPPKLDAPYYTTSLFSKIEKQEYSLMNSSDAFLVWKSSISETAIPKSEPKIQSTYSSANDLKPNQNKLTAEWVMEDGKMVCCWMISYL